MDIFKKVEQGISGLFGSDEQKHSHTHEGEACHDLHAEHRDNRFQSFAPQTSGHVKWHVDGCAYFWALSEALEGQTSYNGTKSEKLGIRGTRADMNNSLQRLKRVSTF